MLLLYFIIFIVVVYSYNCSIDCYYVFRRIKIVLKFFF